MQIPVKVSSRTTRIKTNLQIKELPLFMIIVYFLHFYQKLNNIYTIINFWKSSDRRKSIEKSFCLHKNKSKQKENQIAYGTVCCLFWPANGWCTHLSLAKYAFYPFSVFHPFAQKLVKNKEKSRKICKKGVKKCLFQFLLNTQTYGKSWMLILK